MSIALEQSNSLVDLAHRINVEHEAAKAALNQGLKHAMAAGELLLEAKKQVPHGEWLPWLQRNCSVSERTAQAYMRTAKHLGALDDEAKAQRVADLSFRDALRSVSSTAAIVKNLSPEHYEQAIEDIELHDNTETFRQAVKKAAVEQNSPRFPEMLLPSPNGRKIRVARNPEKRQWIIAIGPSISRKDLLQKEHCARETETVRELEEERAECLESIAELEIRLRDLREQAKTYDKTIRQAIESQVKGELGNVSPFTESYDFQSDENTFDELSNLKQEHLVDRLLAARGTVTNGLAEIGRGYWGDIKFLPYQEMIPCPGAWTKTGSGEWLSELFADWFEADSEPPPSDQSAAQATAATAPHKKSS